MNAGAEERRGWWGRLKDWQQAVLIAVVATVVLGAAAFGQSMLGGTSGADERGARDVCEQFVEKRLKAPASAKYENTTTSQAGEVWTVEGDVDSENSFGAQLRNHYVCTVKPTDAAGDNWELVNIELGE